MNGQGIFKSSLQMALEHKKAMDAFAVACVKLTEDYTVENSVFTFNGKNIDEVTNGFMVGVKVSENMDEIRNEMSKCNCPVIRIQENENGISFELGEYFDAASKINESVNNIYNIGKRAYILNRNN